MGDNIVMVLTWAYGLLSIVYAFERKPWKALYWIGAMLITIAVRKMKD